ncbi:unnamed protein product [Effrenium voratum]|nr:unnamed protein product [Effrenium voratum]
MAKPLGPLPRYGLIGGSGVQVRGEDRWIVDTPFGPCVLAAMDPERRVLFANRHLCTEVNAETGEVEYAPPHMVNYRALVWALSSCECSGVVSLSSTGTLHPEEIPICSMVAAEDYYMVTPQPVTFWGNPKIGAFEKPEGGLGRIHYSPADPASRAEWVAKLQRILQPVLAKVRDKVKFAKGQTATSWPLVQEEEMVYVNTVGPRFETRAEIRSYRPIGHVVGMTAGNEWMLCEELHIPYFVWPGNSIRKVQRSPGAFAWLSCFIGHISKRSPEPDGSEKEEPVI